MSGYEKESELAIRVFNNNIALIHTVEEWASSMNYRSAKTFSRHIKIHFGISAVKVMTQLRVKKIMELMHSVPEDSLFCVARLVGLKDEKSLYDYIKYHTKLSPTTLRNNVLRSKLRSEITEYNLGVKIHSNITQ